MHINSLYRAKSFLASDAIQRTATRLNDKVVMTQDQARTAIRRFNDVAEEYISRPDHPGILSIDIMSILQDELDQESLNRPGARVREQRVRQVVNRRTPGASSSQNQGGRTQEFDIGEADMDFIDAQEGHDRMMYVEQDIFQIIVQKEVMHLYQYLKIQTGVTGRVKLGLTRKPGLEKPN